MNWTMLLRKTLPLAGTAVISLGVGSATAECPRDIDRVHRHLLGNSGIQERYTRGGVDKHDYRALLGAARMFSDMGFEERCQSVLAGIRELSQKADSASAQDRAERGIDQRRSDQLQTSERNRREVQARRDDSTSDEAPAQDMASARPLTSIDVSGRILIGADVRNSSNQLIGKVDDFVLRDNDLKFVIVTADQVHYRVPADRVKVARRGPNGRNAVIFIDMTAEKLRSQPEVERRNDRWIHVDKDRRRDEQRVRRDDQKASADDRRNERSPHQSLKRPEGAWVSVTGKVKAATDEAMVLAYAKGKGHIVVEMNGLRRYARMHGTVAGHRVTVTGIIEKTDLNARRIKADTVYDHTNATYYLGDAGDNYYYYNYNWRPYGYFGYWGPAYMAPSYLTPRGEVDDAKTETTFTIHGQIIQAGIDEFVVQSGVGELQVDVDELADNPLDSEGRRQLKVGDHVSVTGRLDDEDLFDRREIIATHVTLRAQAGELKSEEKKEERVQ